MINRHIKILVSVSFILSGTSAYSQNMSTELSHLIELAFKNNKGLKSYQLQVESSKANIATAYDFNKTSIYHGYDENNIAANDKALRVLGVEQTFLFPTVYGAQRNVYKSQWEQKKALYNIEENKLILDISQLYEQIVYLRNKEKFYQHLDTLYSEFSRAGSRRFELGESNYLEKITAKAKSKQIHTTLVQLISQKRASYEQLKALVQSDEIPLISKDNLELLYLENAGIGRILQTEYMERVSQTYKSQMKLQNHNWLPDINIELFTGTTRGLGYYQNGFQIGVSIPLFFSGNIAKKKTAKLDLLSWEAERSNKEIKMERFYMQKQAELDQHNEMIRYYNENGKDLSQEILKTAEMGYKNGEIDFFQYIQSLENAISIEVDYLESVLLYNNSYLELHYFNFNE
ncbi:TolC family protein [Dysgonomonas sp. ZJ709]|uniref:TolC family protein n=1 Tax=Dysgonomonas sp. ZJ709 TaxID=2709797 RepID=UPI0013EBEB3C|nr:TolC family protein [Dysgonomonas sp. ZJ709]